MMIRSWFATFTAALALCACAAPASNPDTAPAPVATAAPDPAAAAPASRAAAPDLRGAAETITAADVIARLEFIASDNMRGRDTPSRELEIVAGYLVNQYKLWGYQPAGENGTFYQWWPYPLRRQSPTGARLEVRGPRGTVALGVGRDFFAQGGTTADVSGGLVFVGRAQDEVMGEGTLRDRVAVAVLPGTGAARDFRIERRRQRAAAERAGATALVHVLDATWTADSVAKYARTAARPMRSAGEQVALPEFFVTREAAQRLFAAAGLGTAQFAQAGAAGFRPVPLAGLTAAAALPAERLDDARAPNVVAMLPGSDPQLRNEYIVISAHMDHVGVGEPVNGDSIYNGADDDGSGTVGLLEVAQALAALPEAQRPKRTVVFLHVSGEEKGLLGSEWYSDHPTLPLERIVANINVDMIGRNDPDSVVVIGKDYSTLGGVANRAAAAHPELRLTLADDIWPEQRFFFRSDHFNFARKEVPSIFFFSGVHEDYHRPSDHVEKIDGDKAARIARIIFYITNDIANDPQRPQWDPRGLEEVRSMTR